MNIVTHPVAPEEIMAFVDGELPSREIEAISAHIDTCAECSKLAEQLRGTSLSISVWSVPAIPTNVEHSITALAAKIASTPKLKSGLFFRASFWTWKQWVLASGGTLAVLSLAIGFSMPNLLHPRRAVSVAMSSYEPQRANSENVGRGSVGKLLTEPNRTQSRGVHIGSAGKDRDKISSLITNASPGIAADSNGLFHALGDHAANSSSMSGQPPTDQQSKVFSNAAPAPMIAHTVSLVIVTKDFAGARTALETILARHRGYSAQLNLGTPENAPRSLAASLRIPAPELPSAVADLKTLGRVENESHSGEEVTKQHADLVERLRVSRETEQRFLAILQQRTGNVYEVLQVEQEIARVRGDIERMEAEQKALEHRVDFATVELQLTEEYKAELNPPAPSVSTRIHNALVAGYQNACETALGVVLFFAEEGPVLLMWLAILALPVVLLWRRYRRMATAI